MNHSSVIRLAFAMPSSGSDALFVNICSRRALGYSAPHSSRARNVRCQSAPAAALPPSIVAHQGMSP
eukprot:1332763-Lingulodinium_polyedra.AAC.1